MGKAVSLSQIDLFSAVAAEMSRQAKKLPADNRSNAVIKACNMIVTCYGMTNAEFVERFGATGEKLPEIVGGECQIS